MEGGNCWEQSTALQAAGGSGCFPRCGPGRLQVYCSHRVAEEEEGRLPAPS